MSFAQDASEEFLQVGVAGSSGFVDINTMSAVLFVVIASCFLVMLYKLMSFWFIEVLVVLFCIGGVEVCLFSCSCMLSSVWLISSILLVVVHKLLLSYFILSPIVLNIFMASFKILLMMLVFFPCIYMLLFFLFLICASLDNRTKSSNQSILC